MSQLKVLLCGLLVLGSVAAQAEDRLQCADNIAAFAKLENRDTLLDLYRNRSSITLDSFHKDIGPAADTLCAQVAGTHCVDPGQSDPGLPAMPQVCFANLAVAQKIELVNRAVKKWESVPVDFQQWLIAN